MRALVPFALAVMLAGPALAKEKPPVFVEAKAVADKPTVALDPAKAHLILRSDLATPLYLMKVPTAEDQTAYDRVRAAALVEARGKYAKKLASYHRAVARGPVTPGAKLPDEPIEPTEANFEFTPFGMMASVGIGPLNRFAKGSDTSTYVHALTPGTYRIYGLLMFNPNGGVGGSCFCMGSMQFEARAGEAVDLGIIKARTETVRPGGDSAAPLEALGQRFFDPSPAGDVIDPRLAGVKVVPAVYRPVGKLPNYFGVTITRMPAKDGVMRYGRDRIVDLTAGQ